MELNNLGFLEELVMAPRKDSWGSFSSGLSEFFPSGWSFGSFDENPVLDTSNPQFEPSSAGCPFSNQAAYGFLEGLSVPELLDSSYAKIEDGFREDYPSAVEDGELGGLIGVENCSSEKRNYGCKVEENGGDLASFKVGFCGEKKTKSKKLQGQPSKNLMAERRRRKRLNDRLSMLRAIVPKISKMDRTSILGDTIEYMKELLERINNLKEEDNDAGGAQVSLMGSFKEQKANEVLARNSPKFEVERRDNETRLDICCATKPGLLLSTVNTLEALGLEIQQCVISCFNDFSMQASCSEGDVQQTLLGSEDIKQTLFRNAGYGGRCL